MDNNNTNYYILLPILLLLFMPFQINTYRAITYELNRGRLGDHLTTAIKALYAAELIKKEGSTTDARFKFLYKEFEFSDKLAIHTHAKKYNPQKHGHLPTSKITKIDDIQPYEANPHIIYVTDLNFQVSPIDDFKQLHYYIFNNKKFYNKLKKLFRPIIPLSLIDRPNNITSVAIHLRNGQGFDRPHFSEQIYQGHEHLVTYNTWIFKRIETMALTSKNLFQVAENCINPHQNILSSKPAQPYNHVSSSHWEKTHYAFSDHEHPARFPPLQFYIDQIKFLYKNLNSAPLFIHIFTDHPNPQILVDDIKKHINADNIIYSYRKKGNSHDTNTLDDLFAMMEFDCLIRPGSNYSRFAQLMGNHKIIMYPAKTMWIEEKRLLVTEVGIIFKTQQ